MNNHERKLFLISIILEMPNKYIKRITKLAEYLWIYKSEDGEKKQQCSIEIECLKKIFEILTTVDDAWILEQIYRCAVNITKDEKGDVS